MARVVRAAQLAFVALAFLAVVIAAQGWLYVVRPGLPHLGPSIHDALPLDELPRHDSVPLLVFFVVWAIAGLLIGAVARVARVERLTAGLLTALATGAWLLLTTWVSIVVVRQVAAREAFRAALHVPAIYLAAGLVGLGAAVAARQNLSRSDRVPLVLAGFVAAAGLLAVASAITPEFTERLQLVESATPPVVPKLASALIVPTGMALIVLARGLRRRSRRAWQLTVVLALAAAALHILKGLDYEEAIASMLVAIALVACRHEFDRRGDPDTRAEVLIRGLLYVVAIFAYGAITLWINRIAADRRYTIDFALRETAAAAAGVHLRGSQHLSGSFGEWFPLSVFLLALAAAFSLLARWLGPWRYRHEKLVQERERARRLVGQFGVDTLAPFALRSDKSYFFSEDEQAFLAYTVIAGVAVVSGDPIGDPDAVEHLLAAFVRHAHERNWRIAILGAGTRYLDLYKRNGFGAIYHGDEGVIDVRDFSLEGRSIRKVRQSVHRLGRAGYTVEILYARDLGPALRQELERVAEEWRNGEPMRGFTMEFDSFFALDGDDAIFVVGRDEEKRVAGFLHLAVSKPARALSLSSMPRRRETPNGLNEWLVVETVAWARQHGFERVSMNFAPFASLLGSTELSWVQRLQCQVLRQLKGTFQFDNLSSFNRKFFPSWERRYIVYERLADLPRVGLAGLAAEGYLPRVGQRR